MRHSTQLAPAVPPALSVPVSTLKTRLLSNACSKQQEQAIQCLVRARTGLMTTCYVTKRLVALVLQPVVGECRGCSMSIAGRHTRMLWYTCNLHTEYRGPCSCNSIAWHVLSLIMLHMRSCWSLVMLHALPQCSAHTCPFRAQMLIIPGCHSHTSLGRSWCINYRAQKANEPRVMQNCEGGSNVTSMTRYKSKATMHANRPHNNIE